MSIQKKITILFVSSLVMMSLIGFWVEKTSLQKAQMIQQSNYITSAKELFSSLSKGETAQLEVTIGELGLKKVTDMNIMKNAQIAFHH